MTDEQKAKRRAWAESHFGDKNLTDEELDCATYMPSENFSDGWDKGVDFALSHQWISVDERLPEDYRTVLAYIDNDDFRKLKIALAHWDGEDWYDIKDRHIRPSHWLPIPQLNP